MREAGASEVLVWNRTRSRADDLAEELGLTATGVPRDAELLVNATAVGMNHEPDALERLGISGLEPPKVVVDLVYSADCATPVQSWGESVGATVVDGIEVLVRQGARSFEAWTGQAAPLEVMREAALGVEP
jgi:shikimate dehydrogenase